MKNLFTGYILAGGKSSRMKRDKAFLNIGDKTFVENAARILAPVCGQIKIVLNKSQTHFPEKLPDYISQIFDIYENRGALGGIHAAVLDCETKFAVILAVDLPFVTSGAVEELCKIAVRFEDFSAIVPRQKDEKLQPLAAVYRAENCLPKVVEMLSNPGSASMHSFVEIINAKLIEAENLSADENLFKNVNRPQDLAGIY